MGHPIDLRELDLYRDNFNPRLADDLGADSVICRHLRWTERLGIDKSEKPMPGDPERGAAFDAVEQARE